MSDGTHWDFEVGAEVATRRIISRLRAGRYAGLNVYLIAYPCHPEKHYEMQEQSLRKAVREGSPALCPVCRRLGKGQGSKTRARRERLAAVVPEAWPNWPVPESVGKGRAGRGIG